MAAALGTKILCSFILAPIAAQWVRSQEKRICKNGSPLNQEQLKWARQIGIAKPENIKILREKSLAFPAPKFLANWLAKKGFSLNNAAGMSLRYGIFISSKVELSPQLLCHELTHTLQYERCGSIYSFLKQYLFECLYHGYDQAPMEAEADAVAQQVLASESSS